MYADCKHGIFLNVHGFRPIKPISSAISLSFKCGSLIDQLLVAPQRHADYAADLLDVAEETSHVLVRFNRMEESLLAN